MKVLKRILMVILLIVVVIVGIGYAMPGTVRVVTTETISLPPAKVFHFVAGFVDRTAWDPWIKADTAAKCTFDIVPGYVGSRYIWDGPVVGKGVMLVDSVVPGSFLRNMVDFGQGNPIPEEWTFTPSASGGTDLEWKITMTSGSPFGRLANTIFKGMIQKTIDSGKGDLKSYLETHGVQLSRLTEIGIEEYPAVEAFTRTGVVSMEEIAEWFGTNLGMVMVTIQAQNLQPQGMPFAVYSGFDQATGKFTVTAGIPVSAGGQSTGEVVLKKFKSFIALRGLHAGPYDELSVSYEALQRYASENKIALTGVVWEYYLTDPAEAHDPTQILTAIAMELDTR